VRQLRRRRAAGDAVLRLVRPTRHGAGDAAGDGSGADGDAGRAGELLARVRSSVRDPSWEAAVAEAEGWMNGDAAAFARAAGLYASLEIPYEEARCRIEAGDLDRARELLKTFGLEKSPLAARLRERESSSSR
jgi:hypothetical protein